MGDAGATGGGGEAGDASPADVGGACATGGEMGPVDGVFVVVGTFVLTAFFDFDCSFEVFFLFLEGPSSMSSSSESDRSLSSDSESIPSSIASISIL